MEQPIAARIVRDFMAEGRADGWRTTIGAWWVVILGGLAILALLSVATFNAITGDDGYRSSCSGGMAFDDAGGHEACADAAGE